MIRVKRALLSVSDKTGLLDLARALARFGVEMVSTGGTAKTLRDAGLAVRDVAELTGFPEMLDGRVKTLHPKVHGGLLALRDNPEHMKTVEEHGIGLIDMVVVNLYPFEKITARRNVDLAEAIENIDIGGPSMLRSAAKNYRSVAVVSDPARYGEVVREMEANSGILPDALLYSLAVDVFERTAAYDRAIHGFLSRRFSSGPILTEQPALPPRVDMSFVKVQDLRYGENPHQRGAFYRDAEATRGLAAMKQRHGKELSFNNILDLESAAAIAGAFAAPAAVVVKHNNPCGVATALTLAAAYKQAWACDRLSAFGGIIGFNRTVDLATARAVVQSGFMECIVAPGYAPDAFTLLSQKKNIRLMELAAAPQAPEAFDIKRVSGGLLLQDADRRALQEGEIRVVTKRKLSAAQRASLMFGWTVVKYVKSNAIVLTKGTRTVGIGMGQTSRVDSARLAIARAGKLAKGACLASDAFLPKADTVTLAAKAGVKAILQTGGSIADEEVVREADRRGVAMGMTGLRHFRH